MGAAPVWGIGPVCGIALLCGIGPVCGIALLLGIGPLWGIVYPPMSLQLRRYSRVYSTRANCAGTKDYILPGYLLACRIHTNLAFLIPVLIGGEIPCQSVRKLKHIQRRSRGRLVGSLPRQPPVFCLHSLAHQMRSIS